MDGETFKKIRKREKLTMPQLAVIMKREGSPCSVSLIKKIETQGFKVSGTVKTVMYMLDMYGADCEDLKAELMKDLELAPDDAESFEAVQFMLKTLIN